MRRILITASVLVTALFLGSATLVSASSLLSSDAVTVATTPGSHGDDDGGENDEGHGPPPDRGRPDGVGRPERLGPAGRSGPPTLPANASPRAHEAVALAFERQQAIRERVAEIRALPPGPGNGPAVSALMQEFGQLYRLTDHAIEDDDS